MIEMHVKDRRSDTEMLSGTVINFSNEPSSGDVRLLKLNLNTGYEIRLYARTNEIQKLLESFPEEEA